MRIRVVHAGVFKECKQDANTKLNFEQSQSSPCWLSACKTPAKPTLSQESAPQQASTISDNLTVTKRAPDCHAALPVTATAACVSVCVQLTQGNLIATQLMQLLT